MFQPAVSAAMATDLLVCFPTSTRAGANDVGVGSSRVSNQNTGTNQERFHCLSLSGAEEHHKQWFHYHSTAEQESD